MTEKFLKEYKVYLTPLTPVHIGNGDDLIPTNYYIENGFLYKFDPKDLVLPNDKRENLLKLAKTEDPRGMYRFIQNNASSFFKAHVNSIFKVDREIEKKYKEYLDPSAGSITDTKFGNKNEQKKKLEISRTCNTFINNKNQPYIPGSSLKGAIHTAFIDFNLSEDDRKKNFSPKTDLDKTFLNADSFDKSPMRFIKVSDFMPNNEAYTRIVMMNRTRNDTGQKNDTRKRNNDIPQMVEVIDFGQYRAFKGTITVQNDKAITKDVICDRLYDFYYAKIFNLINNYYDNDKFFYLQTSGDFLNKYVDLDEKINKDEAIYYKSCFVRLGKNQGKQSVTLDNKNIEAPKTYNIASVDTKKGIMKVPFGLCLLEIEPEGDNEPLMDYCDYMQSIIPKFNLDNEYKEIAKAKEKQK